MISIVLGSEEVQKFWGLGVWGLDWGLAASGQRVSNVMALAVHFLEQRAGCVRESALHR